MKPAPVEDPPFLHRGQTRGWVLPVVLSACALAVEAAGAGAGLRYDRTGIAAGDAWRLVTGHFAHLGWAHLAMNLAGLGFIWALVGGAFRPLQWLPVLLLSIAGIDAGFWFFAPGLEWYVGLSGLLHAVLAAGAVGALAAPTAAAGVRLESMLLLALLAAKLAWEQFAGPLPGSADLAGGPVVVDAHLFGAVSGAVAGALVAPVRVSSRAPI